MPYCHAYVRTVKDWGSDTSKKISVADVTVYVSAFTGEAKRARNKTGNIIQAPFRNLNLLNYIT